MKSPNFTVFLLVGYYLALFLFEADVSSRFGSKALFLASCAAVLPAVLLLRRRWIPAASLLVMLSVFAFAMLIMTNGSLSFEGLVAMLNKPQISVYAILALVVPGIFFISELDPDRLPHELPEWSGSTVFRPLVAVFAGRERIERRLSTIRETCTLRGIALDTKWRHIQRFHVWAVPLIAATICEAGYAHKLRKMIGSAHRFVPTVPKKPVLSLAQKCSFALLIIVLFSGISHLFRSWSPT